MRMLCTIDLAFFGLLYLYKHLAHTQASTLCRHCKKELVQKLILFHKQIKTSNRCKLEKKNAYYNLKRLSIR